MGEQFWWFYDVIAAAAVLICIFITVKKGLLKALTALIAYIVTFFLSVSLSSVVSNVILNSAVRDSNIRNMNYTLTENDYAAEMLAQMESMGYKVPLNINAIEEIYVSGVDVDNKLYDYVNKLSGGRITDEEAFMEKLHECYAVSASNFISKRLSPYSAEYAAKEIRSNPSNYWGFFILMGDPDNRRPAAEYMVDNYIQPPYGTFIRLIVYIIMFILLLLITLAIAHSFSRNDHTEKGVASGIMCTIIGIAKSAAVIMLIAVVIRLNVIMGSDEMLFFNNEAIDKTYVFKYFYQFVMTW